MTLSFNQMGDESNEKSQPWQMPQADPLMMMVELATLCYVRRNDPEVKR